MVIKSQKCTSLFEYYLLFHLQRWDEEKKELTINYGIILYSMIPTLQWENDIKTVRHTAINTLTFSRLMVPLEDGGPTYCKWSHNWIKTKLVPHNLYYYKTEQKAKQNSKTIYHFRVKRFLIFFWSYSAL